MDSRLLLAATALPPPLGRRVRCRPYSIALRGGKWRRRCVATRSGEAGQVAFSSAALGLRRVELRGEHGHHVREAALPVELVADGLAGAVQGEALVLPIVAAGDRGPLMIAPSISRATTSPEGVPARRAGSLEASS